MARIDLKHETSLSAAEIKGKAETLINEVLRDQGDKISDFQQELERNLLTISFKVKKFKVFSISGTARVYDNSIKIVLDGIPGLAKSKVENALRQKAKELFP